MFCRIYVHGNRVRKQDLLFQLCDLLEEKPTANFYIETIFFSIIVTNNDEYNEEKSKEFPDGFIYFPFNIEIDYNSNNKLEASRLINRILKYFWNNNYSAIAACQFENLLIEGGGYKSNIVPWQKVD